MSDIKNEFKLEWEFAAIQSIRHRHTNEIWTSHPWRVISFWFSANIPRLTKLPCCLRRASQRGMRSLVTRLTTHSRFRLTFTTQFHTYLHKSPTVSPQTHQVTSLIWMVVKWSYPACKYSLEVLFFLKLVKKKIIFTYSKANHLVSRFSLNTSRIICLIQQVCIGNKWDYHIQLAKCF